MSDYKWGTWYPVETRPKARVARKRDLFWIPNWGCFDDATRAPRNATHWMPGPPSPEELAAKPNLETVIRSRIAKVKGLIQGKYAKNPTFYEMGKDEISNLEAILDEAGLE